MRRLTLFFTLGLALAPAACSPRPFDVEVTGPLDRPVLRLKRTANFLVSRSLCVEEIAVMIGAPWSADADTKWKVAAPDECVSLTQLTYGEPTSGLRTEVAAEPLELGVRYRVFGRASGGYVGGAVIVFEEGAWRIAPEQSPRSD